MKTRSFSSHSFQKPRPRNLKVFWALSLFFFFLSCSDDNITKEAMWAKMLEVDPKLESVIPKNISDGVKCSDFGKGCVTGFRAQSQNLEFALIEFETEAQAREEALRIDGYYHKNWVFDDVSGEPVLEKLLQKSLSAQRPLLEIQNPRDLTN